MADPAKIGAKLGPRIASLTAKAVVATKQQLTPHQRGLAALVLDDFFELVGKEQQATIGDVNKELMQGDALPEWGKKLFSFMARGKGQWSMLMSYAVYGTGVGSVISRYVNNELGPFIRSKLAGSPKEILSAETYAAGYARNQIDYQHGERRAREWALDATEWDLLWNLSQAPPALGELMQLYDRHLITKQQFRDALHDASIRPAYHDKLIELSNQLLPAASLADMVVRGIVSQDDAAKEADMQGVDRERFDKMVLQSGGPPAIEELLFLFRRGKIDTGRLERGIRQSRVRNEWIDAVKDLQYVPLSAEAAVQAHVQGHMDEAESRRKWAENGFEPADWQPAFETAGDPIAIGQALDLWNRGQMTEAEVTQAIRESRIKNKYIPFIKQYRYYLPPVRTIVAMLRSSAITKEHAADLLNRNGVRPDDAAGYIAEALSSASSADKDFTASQIRAFYRDAAITRQEASDMLTSIGYDADHVELILLNADLEQLVRARNQAINRVHASYVGHKIVRDTAAAQLHELSVTDTMARDLLNLWDDELAANVRVLTEAQIVRMAKKSLVTLDEAGQYLVFMGYSPRDAGLLLADAGLGIKGG